MDPTNSQLPLIREIHFIIQNYLGRNDVVNYARVNSEYNEMIASNNNLWIRLYPEIAFPVSVNPKEYLKKQAIVFNTKQILERFTKFAAKLKIGQKGIFTELTT